MYTCSCNFQIIPLEKLRAHISENKFSSSHLLRFFKISNETELRKNQIVSTQKKLKELKKLQAESFRSSLKVSLEITNKTIKPIKKLKNIQKTFLNNQENLSSNDNTENLINPLRNSEIFPFSRIMRNNLLGSSVKLVSLFFDKKKTLMINFNRFIKSHSGTVMSIAVSRDLKFLITGETCVLRLWDAKTLNHLKSFVAHHSCIKIVEIDNSSTLCLSSSFDGKICCLNLKKKKLKFSLKNKNDNITFLAFCNDSKNFISTSIIEVKIWNILTKSIIYKYSNLTKVIFSDTFDNHKALIMCDIYGKVFKYDWLSSECIIKEYRSKNNIFESFCLGFGKVVMGSMEGLIQVIDLNTLNFLESPIEAHLEAITSVDICKFTKIFVSSSGDKTIKLWNIETYSLLKELKKFEYMQNSVRLNKRHIYFCSEDSKISIFNWRIESLVKNKFKHYMHGCIAVSARLMLLAHGCKSLRIICMKTNTVLNRWASSLNKITSLSFKNSFILCGTSSGKVAVLKVPQLKLKRTYYLSESKIRFITCSNDFKTLAYLSEKFSIVNLETFECIYTEKLELITGKFDKESKNFYFSDYDSNICVLQNLNNLKKLTFIMRPMQLYLNVKNNYILIKNAKLEFSLFSTQGKLIMENVSKHEVLNISKERLRALEIEYINFRRNILFDQKSLVLSALEYGFIIY